MGKLYDNSHQIYDVSIEDEFKLTNARYKDFSTEILSEVDKTGFDLINQKITNLLATTKNERLFNCRFGNLLMFMIGSNTSTQNIKNHIKKILEQSLPEIKLDLNKSKVIKMDNNIVRIVLHYKISETGEKWYWDNPIQF